MSEMNAIQWLLKHNGDFAQVVRASLEMLNDIQPNGKAGDHE